MWCTVGVVTTCQAAPATSVCCLRAAWQTSNVCVRWRQKESRPDRGWHVLVPAVTPRSSSWHPSLAIGCVCIMSWLPYTPVCRGSRPQMQGRRLSWRKP